jgi:8-oxo-dGTP pyrophosphatase MutT (NUDIX family)
MDSLMRHVLAATQLRLPGHYLPLWLAAEPVGYVAPATAAILPAAGAEAGKAGISLRNADGVARAESALAQAGLFRPRGEAFDVRATPEGPVLARIDRGALPCLGIAAAGVHVNGLVQTAGGWCLWVARRAASKALDAGKLDHLVAGGICAGMDPASTLIKEAGEEAGIAPEIARRAACKSIISYAMERPEGLRRDRLYCYDLILPEDFTPAPQDGEVESFTLMALEDVLARVRATDDFKFNVNLVLIDLFARHGLIERPKGLPVAAAP